MRIAVISTPAVASWGGSEELWAAMAHEALAAGHSVALSPRGDPYRRSETLNELQRKGAKIFSKPGSVGEFDEASNQFNFRAHYQALFTPKPDIVLVNNGGGYEGLFSKSMLDALYEQEVPFIVACRLIYESGLMTEEVREIASEFFSRARCLVYPSRRNWIAAERHLAQSLSHGIVLHIARRYLAVNAGRIS